MEQQVTADGASIRKMAKVMQDIGGEILELASILESTKIMPGHVDPGANIVRKAFNLQIVGNSTTALTNLHQLLYDLGGRLIKLAGVYDTTEDLNTDDVERLRGLVSEVQKYFPDFSPFPPPATTPPPTA